MKRRTPPGRTFDTQRGGAPVEAQQQTQGSKDTWRGEDKAHGKEMVEEECGHGDQGKQTMPHGVCQTMCPAQELREREAKDCLHRFEMVPGTEKDRRPKADPLRTVKEYSRPAAGKDLTNPAGLRPPDVLLRTVCYLIDDIAASPSLRPWTEVYSFVFDRLRSVKQDMIIQRVSGVDCVAILQLSVRFLIYASYRLCGEPLRFYDPRINDRHLLENLSWLLDCYAAEPGLHLNQEEFEALGLLYNLGSPRATEHIMHLPECLRSSPPIMLALSINRAFLERNPVRVLRLASGLNFLQACALHRHLAACRRDLLLLYSHGHSSRNCRFPLDKLSQLLSLDGPLAAQLCRSYGVKVNQDSQVVFSKATFTEPDPGKLDCIRYHGIVSEKMRDLKIENVIHGCA